MNDFILNIQDKTWLMVILCSVAGYLAGSISFARLINFILKDTTHIDSWAEPVPHSDEKFESDLVSATLVAKRLGARYGCLTSLLDMAKVALPTLLVMLAFKEQPWFLLTSFFGVLRHNFPVWYHFVGGRGESPILGSLIVINWYGLLLMNLAGIVLGFITGSVLVVRWSGYILLIFWFWFHFHNIWYVVFMIGVNLLFWLSMRNDLKKYLDLKNNKGLSFSEEDVSGFIMMGKGLGRALDKYSIYALIKKALKHH